MKRVLSQEEIDAMVRGTNETKDEHAENEGRSVKPCTFRQSGQLAGEHVRAVSALHEAFARGLAQSLGAYLGVSFEAKLVSVEQIAYGEFLQSLPEITYMVSFHVSPMNASAAMQIDPSLVFSLIDILLGGTSRCEVITREISEIEAEVMAEVARIICRELAEAWKPLAISLELERYETGAQVQHFLPATEKTICLSFEIRVADTQGTLNLIVPFAVSHPLLRKVSAEAPSSRTRSKTQFAPKVKAKILDCTFPASLDLPSIKVPIHEVLALSPGDVRSFHIPIGTPAALIISGRQVFEARPVRQDGLRAAQIGDALSVSEETDVRVAHNSVALAGQGALT
jgi:flagellar motor switch protein FliM